MSQDAFVAALATEFSDEMIKNLVDYIESGKDFAGGTFGDGSGVGCVAGVAKLAHKEALCGWKALEISGLVYRFNDINVECGNQRLLKQLILREAERRGLIKKEIEKDYQEIDATAIENSTFVTKEVVTPIEKEIVVE